MHKKVKARKVLDGEFDCEHNHPCWKHVSPREDYTEAEKYLALVMPETDAKAYRRKLWEYSKIVVHFTVKDILRAARLDVLNDNNLDVAAIMDDVLEDEKLSPVILIRGNYQRPLCIAHGYEKLCASYYLERTMLVPAVII